MTADEHSGMVRLCDGETPEPHDLDLDLILHDLGVPVGDGVARAIAAEAWKAGFTARGSDAR